MDAIVHCLIVTHELGLNRLRQVGFYLILQINNTDRYSFLYERIQANQPLIKVLSLVNVGAIKY